MVQASQVQEKHEKVHFCDDGASGVRNRHGIQFCPTNRLFETQYDQKLYKIHIVIKIASTATIPLLLSQKSCACLQSTEIKAGIHL